MTKRRSLRLTRASYLLYRHRYLAGFAAIGLCAVALEVALVAAMPVAWGLGVRASLAFAVGLVTSFALNAALNFRVPRRYLLATFGRYALVSGLSFGLNMAAVAAGTGVLNTPYGPTRLASAGCLFVLAYALHRRWTFDRARNFGIAVYASAAERVAPIFRKVGFHTDHVHVDLVDETMHAGCAPVDLGKLRVVRRFWPGVPVALHVMSRKPALWMRQAWDGCDWVLFHLGGEDAIMPLLAEGRVRGKRVGVVWHEPDGLDALMPYLPHVDFVMVLGIAQPGVSGQPLSESAVRMAATLDGVRDRYGFEVMFDGSVNAATVTRLRATYVVAASAVLRAADPVRAIHRLKTGMRYERSAA